MGLCIHYNGKFNKNASLSEMIEEVKDISEIYSWKYHIYEKEFPLNSLGQDLYDDKIYGISFSPPKCEPIWLTFLSNGLMSDPVSLQLYANSDEEDEKKYLYMLSTKTQYSGINVHKIIIHLLKYLSSKYFLQFNLTDEGRYWETGNEKLLDEIFKRYDNIMDSIGSALDKIPRNTGENIEEYFERILKMIHKKINE